MRDRILAEARGNPLALLELPRGLTPAELAGGFGLPDARPLASRIEQGFLQRVQALPRDTQLLLLAAAAEPVGDLGLLWRAAERLGIGGEAGRPAEAAGLIEIGARVRFTHPLVRSAVYRAAAPGDRRDVHRALAEATDPVLDPDRRAWHRAHATAAPDEAVAAELARSAGRAQARGGLAAAAAFLERAAELTPDPAGASSARSPRRRRSSTSPTPRPRPSCWPPPSSGRSTSSSARGWSGCGAQIAFASRRGRDAPPLLLDGGPAARAARRRDGARDLPRGDRVGDVRRAPRHRPGRARGRRGRARVEPGAGRRARPTLLLDALVTRFTEGYAASVAPLSRALRAFGEPDGGGADQRWLWLACRLAQDLWDDELWHVLATRGVRVARETGALSLLPNMANYLAAFNVHSGAFAAAAALIDEVDAITQATGHPAAQVRGVHAGRCARRAGARAGDLGCPRGGA